MLKFSFTDRIFVLTGAGVSAESGIPTFRGAGGVWRNYRVEEVASPQAWNRDPRLVWEFYTMRRQVAAQAKPNPAHLALAALEQRFGERLVVCTQNVDNLHELAGSRRVIHMHGELFKSRCDTCARPPFADTDLYQPTRAIPLCACGGRIRPHICWFGEVPFHMETILSEVEKCSVFIAIGTSGVVEPAASLAAIASRRARTVYVGPEQPANVSAFREVHVGTAGALVPELLLEPPN
jgi:NAD-dependent deacetylase